MLVPLDHQLLPAAVTDVFEAFGEGFSLLDQQGRYTYLNPQAAALIGQSPAALVGQPVGASLPEAVAELFSAAAERAVREQRSAHFEAYLPPRETWFETTLYPHAAGLSMLSRDITTRKRAEVALQFQAQLVEAIDQAVIVTDLAGTITYWNHAAEVLYGWAATEVLGQSILQVTPAQQTQAQATTLMAQLAAGASWAGEFLVQRRDGSTFLAAVTDLPVHDAAGELVGIIGLSSDITAQKVLAQQHDAILVAVTHDLKGPLTSIGGIAQLLQRRVERDGEIAPQQLADDLGRILVATRRMTALVEEHLDLARLQKGESLEVQRSPTDLVALAQAVCAEQQQLTSEHALRVRAAVPTLVGAWDTARLQRVLANLVGNAVKYSPAGGEILVTIQHEGAAAAAQAVLTVADHGIGIPLAEQARVFEQFQRASNVTGIPGSGVGLAGVRQIVEQHGGTIGVASTLGEGSTFTVYLPLAALADEPGRPAHDATKR